MRQSFHLLKSIGIEGTSRTLRLINLEWRCAHLPVPTSQLLAAPIYRGSVTPDEPIDLHIILLSYVFLRFEILKLERSQFKEFRTEEMPGGTNYRSN